MNSNGIHFSEAKTSIETYSKLKYAVVLKHLKDLFLRLRDFTIQVLKNRRYELWQRLLILGMFYEEAANGHEKDHLEHLLPDVAAYVDRMSVGDFKGDLQKSPVDTASQLALLIQLTQARIAKGCVTKAFSECIDESLKGIGFDGTCQSPSKTARKYDEAYQRHYVPFINEHEYILENYLINYIFMSMFPFASVLPFSGIKMYDNYILMVLHYGLIKLYLTGMAAFQESELHEDLVVKLLYSFSRNIESNGDYLRDAHMALKQNGYATMGCMSILLRN